MPFLKPITLHAKFGIKDFERHLVAKYPSGLPKYIQTKIDFLDMFLLGDSYHYVVNIEEKIQHKDKEEFQARNEPYKNKGKGGLIIMIKDRERITNLKTT